MGKAQGSAVCIDLHGNGNPSLKCSPLGEVSGRLPAGSWRVAMPGIVRLAPLARPPLVPRAADEPGQAPRPTVRSATAHSRLPGSDVADQVFRYLQGLEDAEPDWRCNSAGRLGLLVESSREAADAIVVHTP